MSSTKESSSKLYEYTLADIRSLAKLVSQYDLSEIRLERGKECIQIKRERGPLAPALGMPQPYPAYAPVAPAALAAPAPAAVTPVEADDGTTIITSPFVGTFYRAPSPEAPPFVEVGQSVQKGQTLCIVEAMKLMNEIETEAACKIVEILVKNAEPVEFGQALFKVIVA